jgi:hypothetical protein
MVDPASVLASITGAINLVRELRNADKAIDEAQWKLKVADLVGDLADAKTGVVELRDEIEARDNEIARLKEAFAFRGQTVEINNMIYETRDGHAVGMPFCPRCLTVDARYIKLTSVLMTKGTLSPQCPQCKANYPAQKEYFLPSNK